MATRQVPLDFQSSSPDSLVAVVIAYRLPQIRDQPDFAESPGARPPHPEGPNVLNRPDATLLPLPRFQLIGLADFSVFASHLSLFSRRLSFAPFLFLWTVSFIFSLLANGPLLSRIFSSSCALARLHHDVLCFLHLLYLSIISPYNSPMFSRVLNVSLLVATFSLFPARFSRIFFRSLCVLFFCLASPTRDGRYPKSQGGATGHLGSFPKSPALATRRGRGSTIQETAPEISPWIGTLLTPPFADLRYRLDPSPALSGSRAACQHLFDAVFWVLLASWLFARFDDRTLAPPLSMLPPFSRPRQLTSGTIEILPHSMTIRQDLSGPQSPSPESLITVIGPQRFLRICSKPDAAESPGMCPPHRDGTDVLECSGVALFLGALCHSSCVAPSFVFNLFLSVPPRFRWLLVSVLSLLIARFLSLLPNGPPHLVSSGSLVSRTDLVVIFVFFFFLVSRLFFPCDFPAFSRIPGVFLVSVMFSCDLSQISRIFFSARYVPFVLAPLVSPPRPGAVGV